MLTRLIVRNFKRFDEIDIELGNPVVLIGPNNSGKTTALQALSLWEIGLRRWNEKRGGKQAPEKRPGVTINRRDLIAMPVPDANLLWRDLHVRDVRRVNGVQDTQNIRIEIVVEGVSDDQAWGCGLEFDYANEESLYCRPLRLSNAKNPPRMPVPPQAAKQRIAFLPPMSGLAAKEDKSQPGTINRLIGEGQTAQVLRNLCYGIAETATKKWDEVCNYIQDLFGVELDMPEFIAERGEIIMTYRERGKRLDIAACGRGLHQTLLLLAYLYANPGTVLLLDEPDAHLEILRQRQIYQLLTEIARKQDSQVIAASHSEVVLNEAAGRDVVIAFVGKPHRMDDRGFQVLKALKEIGYDQYYQAEQTGWVLYLEGSTDLAILQAFASRSGHAAAQHLTRPFVHYVGNQPYKAREHFFGLQEAKRDLVGIAIYDRLTDEQLKQHPELLETMWKRREIENYLCYPEVLLAYAGSLAKAGRAVEEQREDFIADAEEQRLRNIMQKCIDDLVLPVALRDRSDRWWSDTKASNDFLDRLFDAFFKELKLDNLMLKSNYHILAQLVPRNLVDEEVVEKLDAIVTLAQRARPAVS